MRRIAVTGCSGYIGSLLLPRLLDELGVELVLGLDRSPPSVEHPALTFLERDVAQPLDGPLRDQGIDTAVHLAFVLTPSSRGAAAARRVNVEGSRNVLRACASAGVHHVLYLSSTSVYGAWPDNPPLLTEEMPLRPVAGFAYSRDKAETDALFRQFAREHPQVAVTVLRGCIVLGPRGSSAVAGWFSKPLLPRIPGTDPPMQFIHEDDLVAVMAGCLARELPGVYNVGGEGTICYSEIARVLGKPLVAIPAWVLYPLTDALWRLGLSRVADGPGAGIHFIRYPWVASTEKLKRALGLEQLRSSAEAVAAYVRGRQEAAAASR